MGNMYESIDYQATLRNLNDSDFDLLFSTGYANQYSMNINGEIYVIQDSTNLTDDDKSKIRELAAGHDGMIAYENRTQGTRQRKIGKGKRKMHSKCKKCKSKLRRKSRK